MECGTTSDFCGTGCQSGCTPVTQPYVYSGCLRQLAHDLTVVRSCGGSSADKITIGYYESWSYTRTCDSWTPEDIDANIWTYVKT